MKIKRIVYCLLICLTVFANSSFAAAQFAQTYDALGKKTPFYDPTVTECDPVGSIPLVGSDATEQAWNFFKTKDPSFTPQQIAGIVGNLLGESGLNPVNIQDPQGETQDPSGLTGRTDGWGIMQWTPGNKTIGLMQQAGITTPIYELGSQLELVWWHFNNVAPPGGRNVLPGFKATTTLEEATFYFQKHMEAPLQTTPDTKRIALAQSVFNSFSGNMVGTPGASAANTVTSCPGGIVAGKYALPVDRHFYDEHPEWFTKPHHDYPSADIPVGDGTPIYAVAGGKIISAGGLGSCGNGVIIDGDDGVRYTYCHGFDGGQLDGARQGDTVQAGHKIMNADHTGRVIPAGPGGAHLHFQINVDGQLRCPQPLLVSIADGTPVDPKSLPASGCTN